MYNDPDCKPWTSRSWAPDGYTSRLERTREGQARKLESGALDEKQIEHAEGKRTS
jgi:SP family sugar:H+ symporter-like MFS transporter